MMLEQGLFDNLDPQPKTRVRASDPLTAKAAAKKVKAGSQYEALILAARYHESFTAHELGKRAGLNNGVASYWKRISELVNLEFLRITGTRICTISKHEVQTYALTQPGLHLHFKAGGQG